MRKGLFGILALCAVCYADFSPEEGGEEWLAEQGLRINNWILAQPNGKPITSLDLAKRLEIAFRQQFPQYIHNPEARYQFYSNQWQYLLNEMVNNELVLADAKEKKVEIPDGEVRKSVEELFGPNVVENIDDIGLSYDEALEIVKTNIIVQRMQGYMVNSRAMAAITPDKLQQAFEKHLKENQPEERWTYQVLSLRHTTGPVAESAGITAQALVRQEKSLEEIEAALKAKQKAGELDPRLIIRLSGIDTRPAASLASHYRRALQGLKENQVSSPVTQEGQGGTTVCRLFCLVNYEKDEPPNYNDLENELQSRLFQAAAAQEQTKYMAKLRDHFRLDETERIPKGFKPFSLY